ncbi:MAG: hypothetical protein JXR83_15160, partial [Deltaproteobacteria bacterium]|nr:hypothetical protein [Deltaproteobacteria bacterium]
MKSQIRSLGLAATMAVGALLVAANASAWRPTLVPIAVDGDFSDWLPVLANPNQFTFDGDGSSFGANCAPSIDADCRVGTAGRDIYTFAWTYDPAGASDPAIHLYTERVDDNTSAMQSFYFVMDVDGDAFAEQTDFVLKVNWWANNSNVQLALYPYDPLDDVNGDPMTGDGVPMPGAPLSSTLIWSATQPGGQQPESLRMEVSVPWSVLGVPYGSAILFHVATSKSNDKLSDAEDNCGAPGGGVGRFGYSGIDVRPDRYGNANSPGFIVYAHEVANLGTALDTVKLFTTSSRRLAIELWADLDGDGAIDDPGDALMARDSNGDGDYTDSNGITDFLDPAWDSDGDDYPDTGELAGGGVFPIVIRIEVRTGLSGLTDVTTVHGMSVTEPGEFDTATDTTVLGRITLAPAGDRMGEPGVRVPHPAVATNNGEDPDLGNFEVHGLLGWPVRLYSDGVLLGEDLNGDGTWETWAGDTDGDLRPDTGWLDASDL